MTSFKDISIKNYTYDLPTDRIAQYPVTKRDESKLLVYKDGKISGDRFNNLTKYIESNSILILNNSKVINARIVIETGSGKTVEIFCLEAIDEKMELSTDLNAKGKIRCKCLIGNPRAMKNKLLTIEKLTDGGKVVLTAEIIEKSEDLFIVEFKWNPEHLQFSEILSIIGRTPLPPYIKREPIPEDSKTYQTLYSKINGSVAAPTAGLHFTQNVFESLKKKSVCIEYITLHVGAGTFLPVKSEMISEHRMHYEFFSVSNKFLELLVQSKDENIISAGTTTLRTIESLYRIGIQLYSKQKIDDELFVVGQWEGYSADKLSFSDSIYEVLNYAEQRNQSNVHAKTSLIIVPGYKIKRINGLITNFHQPGSTLLLLIAACIGDRWKDVYEYALRNDFRFLSYGDSSILFF